MNIKMYIAFKWLVGLALAMWIAMCGIDLYKKNEADISRQGIETDMFGLAYKNISEVHEMASPVDTYPEKKDTIQHEFAIFHFFIFISGALAVSIFQRKREIISFTRSKIPKINVIRNIQRVGRLINSQYLKNTANKLCVVVVNISKIIWENWTSLIHKLFHKMYEALTRRKCNGQGINIILLKKIKEIGEERKNLGELLIAAIHENKNIRMHYQLESMAKDRLMRHIENTQKEIKEHRSKYISFQQLYLVTHQENAYLKYRIKKLAKDKEEAEKNLMELMNQVYKSKNNELKAYCSRFIVKTKDNLLNSDVGAEIRKFLQKSREHVGSTSTHTFSEYYEANWPTRFTDVLQDSDRFVSMVSEAPKLKGLPGEYVWTVKDKDGIIEKLYEYDYESNMNDGETIKRIRQYSVYYDKDCLLDFSKSKTVINAIIPDPPMADKYSYPVARNRFLTGSEAFQNFLLSNNNVVSTSRSPAPLLVG